MVDLTQGTDISHIARVKKMSEEVDNEVFDPTGQGVEVVDADFARRVAAERDEAVALLLEIEKAGGLFAPNPAVDFPGGGGTAGQSRFEVVAEENKRLRGIFPRILLALGHEDVCSCHAETRFLENIPDIVREAMSTRDGAHAKKGVEECECARTLSAIAAIASEYLENPRCTLSDAVRLMKCRLQELEAAETRRKIRESWS